MLPKTFRSSLHLANSRDREIFSLKKSRVAICFISLVALSGCATRPIDEPPVLAKDFLPESWSTDATSDPVSNDWIQSFQDPIIVRLVEEALSNNFGLEAARQSTMAAEAAARISRSLQFPTLGARLSSGKQQTRFATLDFLTSTTRIDTLNFSAQWELDIWGKLRNAHLASLANFQATLWDLEGMYQSLAGQVAKAYFNLAEASEQYNLAQQSADSFSSTAEAWQERYERGLIEAFDLRLIRAQAAVSKATAKRRLTEADQAKRSLETLLGRYPKGDLPASPNLPEMPPPPPAGLPSDLMARRPDIKTQENQLIALAAKNRIAQRNWLPQLVLTGDAGTTSNQLSDLLDDDFSVWSAFAAASAPLFKSGQLKAERDEATARENAQLAQYRNTILNAFREVESALWAESELAELEAQLSQAAIENGKAEDQAWKLYERGLVDIISVLDAQRRAFDAKSQFITAQNQRLQNRINLHLALGGGFAESNKDYE